MSSNPSLERYILEITEITDREIKDSERLWNTFKAILFYNLFYGKIFQKSISNSMFLYEYTCMYLSTHVWSNEVK